MIAARRQGLGHLVRRAREQWGDTPPNRDDVAWADRHLTPPEQQLFRRLCNADQRHSIRIAHMMPPEDPELVAAALLHDIGKCEGPRSVIARIAATVCGPRTASWARYLNHDVSGPVIAEAAGARPAVVAILRGADDRAAQVRAADER